MLQYNDNHRLQERANIARDLAQLFAELSAPKPEESFSVVRAIDSMAKQEFHTGRSHEANVCSALAVAQGGHHDPQRAVVPWGAFSRDLNISTPTAGGNLVATRVNRPLDILRPFSLMARLGIRSFEDLKQNQSIPNLTSATTAQWLPDETAAITSSDPLIGSINSQPKCAGALIKASFNFMKQSPMSEGFIRDQLLGAMGAALDQAILAGTGASGQPTGLLVAAGVGSQSGAVTFANQLDTMKTLADANANEDNVHFLTTPALRRTLQSREAVASTDFMLAQNGQMARLKPLHVSTYCPASTIFAGDWSQCQVNFWGGGVEIQIDPFTNFKTGAIQVRALMYADVVFLKPAAFVRHTAAT